MGVKLDLYNDFVTAMSGVSNIKTSGLWNSQINWENIEIPFTYPACFLEFAVIPYTTTMLRTPRGSSTGNVSKQQKSAPDNAIITIHIIFEKLKTATDSFSEIEPIITEVYLALQGLSGVYYSSMLRVEERQDTDHDRVLDWQMDFHTNLIECGELDDTLEDANDPIGTLTDMEINKDLDIDN